MDDVVYIPTMSRIDNLRKVVPHWLEQEFKVRLVVEHHEYGMHNALKRNEGWGKDVYILPTTQPGRGIGYVRNFAIRHASRTRLDAIVMSDDDLYVSDESSAYLLIEEALKPGVIGISGRRSIHDHFTSGATARNHGPILCPTGLFQLFGLNVRNVINCGNYNVRLHSHGEDAEMARQGISRGFPWLIHCDVMCKAIGSRYAPGGISARFPKPDSRTAAEKECMAIIHSIWPKYTNTPDKTSRTSWQKMLDDYIPSWREASAMHGGSLDKLTAGDKLWDVHA